MKILLPVVFAAVLMLAATSARAMDSDAAAKTFARVCATCHGPTGQGMASFPRLAGQSADYIAARLKQYRAGEKVGPNSPLMMPHAVNLSDAEITNLSDYIATTFQ